MKAFPSMPGVPAAGHIGGGFWHPGAIDTCTKCHPRRTGMQASDLKTNQLVQTPHNEVLKVSNVYPNYVTAQVVYPVPPRTTVRQYRLDEVATWKEPSDQMIAKYDEAWGRR